MDDKSRKYTEKQIFWIKSIYIIFIIIWVILIAYFKLYTENASIVLFIPPILFILAFFNVEYIDHECSNEVLQTSFIFVGIIFALPLLKWLSKFEHINIEKTVNVIVLAIMLLMFSYLHLFISFEVSVIWRHCRSCLEVMAVTLFIYTLSMYFIK